MSEAEVTADGSEPFATEKFNRLLADLEQATAGWDAGNAWPASSLERLADSGVLGWVIPPGSGGGGVTSSELIDGYRRLAGACLVTAFILTQRNGACQRLVGCDNEPLKEELLPPLASGRAFATVGVSHLTTSRQHLDQPAVSVEEVDAGFRLTGNVPWVTGAAHADWILTGGTLGDGRQLLLVLPTSSDGVDVLHAEPLLALDASHTASVQLDDVPVDRRFLVAGPVEQVMRQGAGGGTGSLTTSALAIGAAGGSLGRIAEEASSRRELDAVLEPLQAEFNSLVDDLAAAAAGESTDGQPRWSNESIRQRANSLVLRSAQAYLAASKGRGFTAAHPASRAVREAMFFLVWSCPQPVIDAAMREFACTIGE